VNGATNVSGARITATAPPQPAVGAVYTGPKFSARVTDVLDGDTVDVAGPNGVTIIRFAGIDARVRANVWNRIETALGRVALGQEGKP
jgi:endonuclease YncB( thermonuclease family)